MPPEKAPPDDELPPAEALQALEVAGPRRKTAPLEPPQDDADGAEAEEQAGPAPGGGGHEAGQEAPAPPAGAEADDSPPAGDEDPTAEAAWGDPPDAADEAWWASSPPAEAAAPGSTVALVPIVQAAPPPEAPAPEAPAPEAAPPPEADSAGGGAPPPEGPGDGADDGDPELPETAELEAGAVPPALAARYKDETRSLEAGSAPQLSASRSVQGLAATAARDIGRVRSSNQDSVFALITSLPREGVDVSVGLFIVADGMGGHEGGEIASRLAVRTVAHQVLSELVLPALDDRMDGALQPLMISAVQEANRAIFSAAQAAGTDMGTTCTAVLMVGTALYVAHVGDSRCYIYEAAGLRQLTTDHSTVGRLIQLGHLDPSEAREHPLRNQLYRTVGQQPHIHVDFIYHPTAGASHLLLCSDGLWGMVDEPLLEGALGRNMWPQDACNELIALANLAGGEDNIAAVVVTLPIAER